MSTRKGGSKKHRKVYRDNIQGITDNAIARLAKIAGVKRISGIVYEEIRGVIKSELDKIAYEIAIIKEYSDKKTITSEDLRFYLEKHGERFYGTGIDDYQLCVDISKRHQKGNCLFIQKLPFERLVKEIFQDYGDYRFSASFLADLQYYLEQRIIAILHNANELAVQFAGRVTLMPMEIQYVRRHQCKLRA